MLLFIFCCRPIVECFWLAFGRAIAMSISARTRWSDPSHHGLRYETERRHALSRVHISTLAQTVSNPICQCRRSRLQIRRSRRTRHDKCRADRQLWGMLSRTGCTQSRSEVFLLTEHNQSLLHQKAAENKGLYILKDKTAKNINRNRIKIKRAVTNACLLCAYSSSSKAVC